MMTDLKKIERTLSVFEEYERRFAAARAARPLRSPWLAPDREEILRTVRDVLRFDESTIPPVRILKTQTQRFAGIEVRHQLFESWEHFYGVNSLFVPEGGGRRPLVVICPGHAKDGRFGYQRMAVTLARQGAYALILENIGQGCRGIFGHWNVPEVFHCGKTMQGLVVAEACGWIRYMKDQPFVDAARLGACGNSGGGTLTTFLCALEPSLQAVASCGYSGDFAYVLQKEKTHCDCNLLAHAAGRLEMWECHSLFAPKPLLLENGLYDDMLPADLFRRNARKVRLVYERMGAGNRFHSALTETRHSWEEADMDLIGRFFAEEFGLAEPVVQPGEPLLTHADVDLPFPEDARTTAEMVQELTGITAPPEVALPHIIRPQFEGRDLDPGSILPDLGSGSVMRILAQFELML